MKTIGAAKFKEQCLALLETVGPEGIVITKHGRPVARLLPVQADPADLVGCLKGTVTIADPKDDLLSTGLSWDAES